MTLYAELRQLQFWSRLTGQLDSQIEILISRLDDVPSQNVSILRIWESRASHRPFSFICLLWIQGYAGARFGRIVLYPLRWESRSMGAVGMVG